MKNKHNRLSISLNINMGGMTDKKISKPDKQELRKTHEDRKSSSILVNELKKLRKDMEGMHKKMSKGNNNSILINELKNIQSGINKLPHTTHAGGG